MTPLSIYDHNCTRCQLSSLSAQTICMAGVRGTSRGMIIGEAPGRNEDELGVPFVGRAGRELDQALHAAGILRDVLSITNAVKCRPPANRAPLDEELYACHVYLRKELEEFKPTRILTVGGVATRALLPSMFTSIGQMRGQWWHIAGCDVMATWHPAYVMRKPVEGEVWHQFRDDVAKFAREVLNGRS